ncbi:MAG: secretion protein HlyD [Ferruginibacter sp.]|nr:secretion protein HlyD [Ferruginibacter sp.]
METDNNIPNPPTLFQKNISKNLFTEHGSEIEEIISKKMPLVVKWGTVYFLFLLLFLAIICWLIQYPDVVNINAKLTSINAPKEVTTKTAGKLVKLFAKENKQVKQADILGYMESIANHEEVINLSNNIDTIIHLLNKSNLQNALSFLKNNYTNLGELQSNYQSFSIAYQTFKNYLSNGFYLRKKSMLTNDLSFLQKMHNNLLLQKELNTQDLALQQKTFDANQSLKEDKVISELDYRNESSKLINKKLTLPQISSSIISNEAQQNEKLKEIDELENAILQQKNIFVQASNTFKSQIDEWKKNYLLSAPIDGKIAFATFLQENQQLQANQTICFVNPENVKYYAEVYIPQINFGKIKNGQIVLLKFPSYPFQEYGSVSGKIDFISNINTDSGYLSKIILPYGLITSYKKQVQFRNGLTAQGEIITQNMRLLQRFYFNIIKQIKK